MTDDPLDLTRVAADDVAIEQLRLQSVNPDDSALQLLRDLLVDVDRDLPQELPVGSGSTVLRLAGEATPDTRIARGGTVVALIAAGIVAFGGVAAASTAVAPGNPLHGLGESVRSAAGAVVDAVKPPDTARDADPDADPHAGALPAPAASRATEALTARPSVPVAPAPEVAAQARSDAAARQVTALLDEAAQLLERGRADAASSRLDVAERRLSDVTADAAAPLRSRLAELRAQVEAAAAERPGPAAPAQPAPKGQPKADAKPDARPEPKADAKPDARPEPKQEPRSAPRTEPGARSAPQPADQPQGPAAPAGQKPATADEPEAQDGARTLVPAQPSRLASTKPRA